jgi:hypothetical protein
MPGDFLFHAGADQSLKLVLKIVERRMGVKLGIAGRQDGQQFQEVLLIHPVVLEQTEKLGGMADVFAVENGQGPP